MSSLYGTVDKTPKTSQVGEPLTFLLSPESGQTTLFWWALHYYPMTLGLYV